MRQATGKKTRSYVFRVSLGSSGRVWRRITLRSDQTLEDLHEAIFRAFDRYDEHLYSFYFPRPGARGRDRLRSADEYTHPYAAEEPPLLSYRVQRNAAKTRLASLPLRIGQRFHYTFDFGDSWEHEITVEQTDGPVGQRRYPSIIEKHGASPPQYPEVEEDEGL